MEIHLLSRFTFKVVEDACFAFTMLSPSNETPNSIEEVRSKYVSLFRALEDIEFSEVAQFENNRIECEWTFFDMDVLSAHLVAFGELKQLASYHFISTDDEVPSYLVSIVDTKIQKHYQWNGILVDEWDVLDLLNLVEKESRGK